MRAKRLVSWRVGLYRPETDSFTTLSTVTDFTPPDARSTSYGGFFLVEPPLPPSPPPPSPPPSPSHVFFLYIYIYRYICVYM